MSRFRNVGNGVEVSVDDAKDGRFAGGLWEPVTDQAAEKTRRRAVKKPHVDN